MKKSASPRLLIALACLLNFTNFATAAQPPNIIFIMADDLGWADVQFNGNKRYETPNIDRLVADGLKLNQCYSGGPNCAPTRACLMTGMYTPRHHLYTPGGRSKGRLSLMKLLTPGASRAGKLEFQSNVDTINPKHVCIPELLKKAGYKTARMGKWHLGKDNQGFDFSTSNGSDNGSKKHYGSKTVAESLTDAAVKYIEENKDGPFFLYLTHWDVHGPVRAKQELVEKYTEKKAQIGGDWKPAYAGMVEQVDQSVARVRKKVEELGIAEQTLIIFTSDNGGAFQNTTNKPLRGCKGSLFEGGIRVPSAAYWKGITQSGTTTDTPITSVDLLPTLLELAGVEFPKDQPVDGRSFVPLLKGEKSAVLSNRAIFWHFPLYLSGRGTGAVVPVFGQGKMAWRTTPVSVIRKGDWKLIQYFEEDAVKLFNITKDPFETKDVAASEAKVRDALLIELQAWQKKVSAPIPTKPNPAFTGISKPRKNRKKK